MNNHADVQKRLSAYCSEEIPPTERMEIESHLNSCPRCRRDLADLKTTLHLIRTVPEVEAPTWMKSRIMANLREEQAARPKWFRRIWFPVHTGVPVRALALLIVCVSGYYLSQSVDTELQTAARQKLQDSSVQQSPAPPQTQPGAPTSTQEPAQPTAVKTSPAPAATATQPVPHKEIPVAIESPKHPLVPTQSPAPGTGAPPYAAAPPAVKDRSLAKGESAKAAPAAESANQLQEWAPEKKAKSLRRLESSSDSAAPMAAGRAQEAPAGMALPQPLIRLSMFDTEHAPALLRDAVTHSGGSIVSDQSAALHRFRIRIPTERQSELLSQLKLLARITEQPTAPLPGASSVELTLQW